MSNVTPEQILAPLNDRQRLAAGHMEGPLLILAGPGSGKTRVITHRIAHLIVQGVPSEQIVALTFTNKAAEEMRKRIAALVPGNRVWTSTFHRFCSRLLRQHASLVGMRENFTIYDSGDSRKVVKQAIENTEVSLKHYTPEMLASRISDVKNRGLTIEHFQPRPGHSMDAILARVYPEYQKLLQMANAVDFDDLLLYAVDLLKGAPELRQSLDERFAYMMVDEYQDTNLTQYQLIRLLNHTHQNLAVTGDPDQSIYGWRGANIHNILHFERDYDQVQIVRLEQNYRSTKSILSVADQLIRNNSQRKEKDLFTQNEQGAPVRLVTYPSPQDEAIDIADSIALAVQQGQRPRDFAILYRTNYLSRALEHALRSVGVPYQIINGHEFYQRREIKDLMGYLHLLNNPDDNVAFERIINTPPRKIGKVTVGRLRRFARDHELSLLEAARQVGKIESIKKGPASKITQFVEMFERLSAVPPDSVEAIIKLVIEETDYRNWLTLDGSEEAYERAGNVDELVVAASEYDRDHEDDGNLEAYLEQVSLVADTDVWEAESDFVTLMTLHAAKGLEFPSVFIVGLEDGILPHERSASDDDEVEEERRLFFVGITRAQSNLQVSRCQNRFRRGSYWPAIASRFLMELPRHEMQIFEPAGRQYDNDSLADAIDEIDPWLHEGLPSVDIHNDQEIRVYEADPDDSGPDDDVVREAAETLQTQIARLASGLSPEASPTTFAAAMNGFPRILTAAELQAKREIDPFIRLHPDKFEIGMEVEHAEYGAGTIEAITGDGQKRTATIEFSGGGRKRFRLAFVPLRLTGNRS